MDKHPIAHELSEPIQKFNDNKNEKIFNIDLIQEIEKVIKVKTANSNKKITK